MATSEVRTFEHNGLEIDVVMTVGHNEDEMYYPGGEAVPQGRQEIVAGVKEVRYDTQRGGENPSDYQKFNHDIGLLERDNAKLKRENEQLKRQVSLQEKRLETLGFGQSEEK